MAAITLTTVRDVIDRLTDFTGANPGGKATKDVRRALVDAYREIATAHKWTYFYDALKLHTNAPMSASPGTIQYQSSSGSSPRLVTLTGDVWPSWAAYGTLVVNNFAYEVAQLLSPTTLQLSIASSPAADLAAGTAFTLYQDAYPLPANFSAMDNLVSSYGLTAPSYVRPGAWLNHRTRLAMIGRPRLYTFAGDDRAVGTLVIRFWPSPDTADEYECIYQRRPNPWQLEGYQQGTATVNSSSLTVVGAATSWRTVWAGQSVRFAYDQADYPSGPAGVSPFAYERTVMAVTDPTHLTVDALVPENLTNVKYVLSDLIDLEDGPMMNAFFRLAEMMLGQNREKKDYAELKGRYERALILAKEADMRTFAPRAASVEAEGMIRMRDFPLGPNIS